MKMVPRSPASATERSSRRMRTEMPMPGRPSVDGSSSRSSGVAIETMPVSVEP